jgi:hypothetical protein
MVQPLHDARVAEMKQQEAERERQRIGAEYRHPDCAPSRSRFFSRLLVTMGGSRRRDRAI